MRCRLPAPFRLTLCAAMLGALGAAGHAQQQSQQLAGSSFNEEFLNIGGDQPHADLSLFSFGNRVLAGKYMVDVSLNERGTGQTEIRFVDREGRNDAEPCITRGMLDDWGVNVAVFAALVNAPDDACIDLSAISPEARYSYDAGRQRLFVSIPQAALKRSARGAVGPEKWSRGITAGMLDYQLNFARYSGDKYRNDVNPFATPQSAFDGNPFADTNKTLQRNTLFAGLRAGFNYEDWRFRHYSTYNRGIDGQSRWQGISTYAQRDIAPIKGSLLIGDGNTPGNFFDSVPFRGVQLASDDAMLPDSQQGYAPTVRGVAQTNARVTVRQNGYVIYSTFVAPGPFVIDDLYPTVSSGDIEVTITEADGREIKYTQAFSAVPTLLREGTWRYSATVGKYRNNYFGTTTAGSRPTLTQPTFVQATLARGLGNEFTLYGGLLAANIYQSVLVGLGKNMKDFGAVSVDLSAARTTDRTPVNGERIFNGQSLRFLYSKAILSSGTNFRVAGYRYSTSGFRTFQEAVQMQDLLPFESFNSRRNEIRFEVSQQIKDWGSVFASARQQSYWGTSAKERLVQVGYSGNYRQFGYSVYYNYTTSLNRAPVRQLMFTLSIPLGDTRASAQYAVNRDSTGRLNQQASVYGSAFDDSRLTYNVTASNANQGAGSGASASASYLSSVGRLDLGYSQGRGYGQSTVGVAGGLLFHGGGVTASQPLGETVVLVQAPKAQGVGFESRPGVATDWAGNAVIPNMTPYRLNRVAIRTGDLGDTVEVKNAATEVVPTRGAVVVARFETSVGFRLLMVLTDRKGRVLPLGSKIENEAGQEVGIVGPEGQAFVTGAGNSGRLTVRWGQGPADQCVVPYSLPDEKNPPPIRELNGQCAAIGPDAVQPKGAE
ncbi:MULTISPECIES: fimbria/pilus outer membrane usher protein [unclassified Variovorax]|jgi:outer membrane usher protein|uniref:fimbria/pilus outer membrane usher protein n=1 Tax=unclassified Variovorax TaxID=663243 RepID=UPI000F7ED5EC|nr:MULTISPECIES: fimbria/pilus outer membrane usher protein [unclassified Variovorax]RSZ31171.1 fimbrial biogenesis outer membrane usher protein [Variovorax sp. 553]RSZ31587.1 fimbrial biogenesis outer membrane usher protein [Variovorax sp. 679]